MKLKSLIIFLLTVSILVLMAVTLITPSEWDALRMAASSQVGILFTVTATILFIIGFYQVVKS